MTKEQILSLLAELQIVEQTPHIHELLKAKDREWIIEQPVRVDTSTELMHLNTHREAMEQSNIENWGFKQSREKLSEAGEFVEFVAFKAAGYSAKVYLDDVTEKFIGLVVTKRQSPAPNIDSAGRTIS